MTEISLGHYLTLGAVIFSIGIIGIFLNRKNIIVILMSIELILTVAAAEAAIGLAIIVVYYRNSGTIRVEEIDKLKG
jgi:NADH-quinone oxidoreductase subunit K